MTVPATFGGGDIAPKALAVSPGIPPEKQCRVSLAPAEIGRARAGPVVTEKGFEQAAVVENCYADAITVGPALRDGCLRHGLRHFHRDHFLHEQILRERGHRTLAGKRTNAATASTEKRICDIGISSRHRQCDERGILQASLNSRQWRNTDLSGRDFDSVDCKRGVFRPLACSIDGIKGEVNYLAFFPLRRYIGYLWHSGFVSLYSCRSLPYGDYRPQAKLRPAAPPVGDYSKEAAVGQLLSLKANFENDGTSTQELTLRARIQSDAGVKRYGLLTFTYQGATQTIEVEYLRVRKPDGSVVMTPPDNIQDMDAGITREAPFYSDLREKHAAVKGLSVGDLLEYQVRWHTTKALAPGQFWYDYDFEHEAILLDEQLQVSVPRDRPIKMKSPSVKPAITEGEWVGALHVEGIQPGKPYQGKRGQQDTRRKPGPIASA